MRLFQTLDPVPFPDPIETYEENGVLIKVYKPRFAEGYEGNYTEYDINRTLKKTKK